MDLVPSPRRLNAAPGRPEGLAVRTIAIILVGHILIGIGAAMNRNVANVHAAVTVVVALAVMFGSSRPERIVAVATYGGLCDVFWRMSHSKAPWELSKYLLAFGALALLIRFIRSWPRGLLPVFFFAALVPGMMITVLAEPLGLAREMISIYEMGLLSFGLAALAFRHLTADQTDAWNLGWVLLGPLVATLSVTTYSIVTNPNLDFSANSNFATSGGYGPNQVSSIIGLIILICVLIAFLPNSRRMWPVLIVLGLWATAGTLLTFSRGGIYSAVIAGCAMLLVGVGTRGARARSLILIGVSIVALFFVFSAVNDFSGNWLDTRYEKAGTTGRDSIAKGDLEVFGSHPLWGVGSGRTFEYRITAGELDQANTHTEFTRLVAEHGVFGLIVMGLMVAMLVQAYRTAPTRWNRLMVVALGVWSATTMLHAATRVGAVGTMLALTQLRVGNAVDPAPAAKQRDLTAPVPSPAGQPGAADPGTSNS